jgi:predicted MPP superfamily phosphohydrolase
MTHWIAGLLLLFALLDFIVWRRMYVLLGNVKNARQWRVLLAALIFWPLSFCVLDVFFNFTIQSTRDPAPSWLLGSIFIWHFIVLPVVLIGILIDLLPRAVLRVSTMLSRKAEPAPQLPNESLFSRRHFLKAAALTVPPAAALALSGVALAQIGKFRVNPYHLKLANWPGELEGFTIALVADIHVGAFSTPKMLADIVNVTNNLKSDLILLGGDLVNISHGDLPSALDYVMQLEAPCGVYNIQGNHDCVQGPDRFDRICARRGLNMLVDSSTILRQRGAPIQILGTRWTDDAYRPGSVELTAAQMQPEAFPIMLAHHPHCWDTAAKFNIPLVLSGHTHGGQLMLTKNIGGGPLRFKYWSGLYERPGSKLLVSNGVGNWFPLRVNAPAEIVHITMHAGA